jgi:hypothetical protein
VFTVMQAFVRRSAMYGCCADAVVPASCFSWIIACVLVKHALTRFHLVAPLGQLELSEQQPAVNDAAPDAAALQCSWVPVVQ